MFFSLRLLTCACICFHFHLFLCWRLATCARICLRLLAFASLAPLFSPPPPERASENSDPGPQEPPIHQVDSLCTLLRKRGFIVFCGLSLYYLKRKTTRQNLAILGEESGVRTGGDRSVAHKRVSMINGN